jgi:hypothetical protein
MRRAYDLIYLSLFYLEYRCKEIDEDSGTKTNGIVWWMKSLKK